MTDVERLEALVLKEQACLAVAAGSMDAHMDALAQAIVDRRTAVKAARDMEAMRAIAHGDLVVITAGVSQTKMAGLLCQVVDPADAGQKPRQLKLLVRTMAARCGHRIGALLWVPAGLLAKVGAQ